jgi:hypothetical protein
MSYKETSYEKLKNRQSKEFSEFPMFFAFSNGQFKEGMEKIGLTVDDTDKIYKTDAGGFYLKTDSKRLRNLIERHESEMSAATAADTTGEGFVFEMFDYELSNHEYCITGDTEDTLDALGVTREDIQASETLLHGLNKAIQAQ